MANDPGIMCFKHCAVKIYCIDIPALCPKCNMKLNFEYSGNRNSQDTELLIRIPYPFVNAFQTACSIVLRPCNGDFLNAYKSSDDLHIAITSSQGHIIEFDRSGLEYHRKDHSSEWKQCLVVFTASEQWYDYWDNAIKLYQQSSDWTASSYDEVVHNCYTFVFAFLATIRILSEGVQNKSEFCKKYILPKTVIAAKYISVYRKILEKSIFVAEM